MASLTTRPQPIARATVVLPPVLGALAGRSRMAGYVSALAGH